MALETLMINGNRTPRTWLISEAANQEQCYEVQTAQPPQKDVTSLGLIVRDRVTRNDESVLESLSETMDFARKTAYTSTTADVSQAR